MGAVPSDRVVAALRGSLPLEAALRDAAQALCAALRADGVTISVKRDGRTIRGLSGTPAPRAHCVSLEDIEFDGTLRVTGNVDVAAVQTAGSIVTLALAARFLGESAQFDGLTGVLNRRSFDARLREEWSRAERSRASISLALIDVDHFKAFNDRRGHQAGDDVLRRVARGAAAAVHRAGDRFARYGGEEFVVILPDTDLAGAIASAEHMRAAVRALSIPHPLGKAGRVTASIGVACATPATGGTAEALVEDADRQLYRAKASGRDRVAAEGYLSAGDTNDATARPIGALRGREAELNAVLRALDECGIVTLTGPEGIGKTRLALAVAVRAARFTSVTFVDASGSVEGAGVADVLRGSLDVRGESLLVVDGCEQVAAACAAVLEGSAEAAHVLVTSRVPLGIERERVIRLQPVPDDAARALFCDRAATAGVVLDPDDESTVKLLRRLGGMPGAIEMAAMRLRASSLDEALDAVKARSAGAPRATLASLLGDAVAALTADQRTALVGITAFAGAFTAGAAAVVVPLAGLNERRAEVLLSDLAGAELLETQTAGGVTRWRAIDPVRGIARETAGAFEIERAAFRAHLHWCLSQIQALDSRFGVVENREFCETVAPLLPDLKLALDRALRDRELVPDGMALCRAAVRFWFAGGQISEAQNYLEAYLDVAEGHDVALRLQLLNHAMRVAFAASDFSTMERYARVAESLAGGTDSIVWASTLNYLGLAAKLRGEYDVAEARFRENRDVSVRIGYRRGEAVATGALGTIAQDIRLDFAAASQLYALSARIFREIRDDLNATIMTANTAVARTLEGDLEGARPLATEALAEARTYGYPGLLVHTLDALAAIEVRSGEYVPARALYREALDAIDPKRDFNYSLFCTQLAFFAASTANAEQAAAFLGASEAADARNGTPTQPLERYRREEIETIVRPSLAERYAIEFERGKRFSDDEAVAAVRRFLEGTPVTA